MIPRNDPFDPNNWHHAKHEFRIYGDDQAQTWGLIDEEDYQWAVQWRWCWKKSHGSKLYLRRAVGENANGMRLRTYTLYLHVEVQKRKGIAPPSPDHLIVDHRNGDSTDCRRRNLRWATPSMNARNIHGSHAVELIDEETPGLAPGGSIAHPRKINIRELEQPVPQAASPLQSQTERLRSA